MSILLEIITVVNSVANAVGKHLLSPIGFLPGWLSNTLIAAFMGTALLVIFKYTSNQAAIERTRNKIKENLLAIRLYKDSVLVILSSEAKIFGAALLLLLHSLRPMLVMMMPVLLLLVQMGLWYQYRPINPNETTIVTMGLNDTSDTWPKIELRRNSSIKLTNGPARILSKKMVCWEISTSEPGYHKIVFNVDDKQVEKDLAVGDGFMRVSSLRPQNKWSQVILNPSERPFHAGDLVKFISIEYPLRQSGVSGSGWWAVYFFVASMVIAFIFKPFLRVKI
jgi:uncharacterized membrane protein (DUF106 family)